MGAWGTGFWSDDDTCDVREDYLDRLRKKKTPEEALAEMLPIYMPDQDGESGYLFWLTIALLQWEYGHLTEPIKEKALAILSSNVDDERWAEASPSDRRKRRQVMEQLAAKLRTPQVKPKKLRPYVRKRNRFQVGDVLSLRFGTMKPSEQDVFRQDTERFWPFQNLYGAALIVDFWEVNIGDIYINPVVALYDWLGAAPARMSDLEAVPFFRTEFYSNEGKRYFWAADMPLKREFDWYDLQVIGHLDRLPFTDSELAEGYIKDANRWGTLEKTIADPWLETGRELPKKPETE